MKEVKNIQGKYNFFLMTYERAVKKYIPFYQVKEIGKKSGLTESVIEQKMKGTEHGWKLKENERI